MCFAVPHYILEDNRHKLFILCLGAEHTQWTLGWADYVHCEHFIMRKHSSCLTLFDDQGNFIYTPHGWGPAAAEVSSRLFFLMGFSDGALRLAWERHSGSPSGYGSSLCDFFLSRREPPLLGIQLWGVGHWGWLCVECNWRAVFYCPLDHIRSW